MNRPSDREISLNGSSPPFILLVFAMKLLFTIFLESVSSLKSTWAKSNSQTGSATDYHQNCMWFHTCTQTCTDLGIHCNEFQPVHYCFSFYIDLGVTKSTLNTKRFSLCTEHEQIWYGQCCSFHHLAAVLPGRKNTCGGKNRGVHWNPGPCTETRMPRARYLSCLQSQHWIIQ